MRCGGRGEQVAHYSGKFSYVFGKGHSQKASDHMTTRLCRECHEYFDRYEDGNDLDRALEFMLCILRAQHLLILTEKISARKSGRPIS